MKPQLKSTSAARNLIKRFEPFRDTAMRADNGRWIVGYGHRAAAKEGAKVSADEADLLLIYDVLQAEQAIEDVVNSPLKPAQRDALVSFVHDIGDTAFKRSDVARYLFEGRTMAAGEALAIYGDSRLDRREAESALFMTSFAPPASKKAEERENATVELVIKVEHPSDAPMAPPVEAPVPVLEIADAAGAAPGNEIAPPPSAREIAARREAEDEIARILAVVGEMPIEMRAPQAAPETTAEPAPVIAPQPSATAEPDPALEAALAQVEAVEAAVAEAQLAADTLETDTPEAEANAETVVEETPDQPESRPAPRRLANTNNGFVSNIPTVPLDLARPAEPEETPLPDALDAVAETPVDTARGEAAAAQVVARMSQEIEHVQMDAESPVIGRAAIQTYDETLPEGATLGFALAGQLAAHFPQVDEEPEPAAADDTVEAELVELAEAMADVDEDNEAEAPAATEPEMISLSGLVPNDVPVVEAEAPVEAEPAEAEADAVEAAPVEVEAEPETQTAEIDETADDVAEAVTARVHDVVEKVIAAADDETPPPHPSFDPVDAADGMLGEVEADPSVERAAAHLVDDIADERRDPVIDDDFSPEDLAAGEDVFTGTEPATAPKDRSTIMFVLSLIAGLVVAGIGGVAAFPSLDQIWGERQLNMEAWMFIGGILVFFASAAQLFSIWMEKQQDKVKS